MRHHARRNDGCDGIARRRIPRPLIPERLPTGRGATEQPNAGSDEPALLTPTFWLLLLATGVATGLFAAFMMFVLHTTQHIAYNYRFGMFQAAVERTSWERRVIVLAIAGAVAGPAWYLLRRWTPGERPDVHGTLWTGGADLSIRRSFPSALLSEFVVGSGASLGREQAPQLLGAVSGTLLGKWGNMSPEQRRLLLACGSGSGLAAVYNVPLGGAVVIAELLYGRIALSVVLPALVSTVAATLVARIYIPSAPTYVGLTPFHFSTQTLVWALLAGPLIGLVAVSWTRLIGFTTAKTVRGRSLLVSPLAAFLGLAGVGYWYPQLFGNGKDLAYIAFIGKGSALLFLALFALKPIVTALCLGSGANGGLFTPTLSTGAALGAVMGDAWGHFWPGTATGAYALIGAGAMIGAALQAPVAGLILILELTQTAVGLTIPLIVATVLATATARYLDGYSIYSSRLPAR
jgi:chloride channel protein, CIC family